MPSAGVLFSELSDDALIERVSELACRERRATAQLIAALTEFDRRRLYLPLGCSSLFTYCTQILHLSEHAAYNRIEAARAVMRFPTLLHYFEDGSITLTAIRLLSPCLTTENLERSIEAARHKKKRDIEVLVAGLRPQTDWSVELGLDLRPASDVGLTLNAFHRWVSDTEDFTPVGPPDALVDAPGNIGSARIYGAQVVARVPQRFLHGATANIDLTWQHSAVSDPLTGARRPISEFQDLLLTAALRQDLPRAAWGLGYTSKSASRSYLLREIDRERASPSLDVFVELPLAHGLRVRAAVISLLGQEETRERRYFDPDRRAGDYSAERSAREPGHWFQLSVSGSF